MRNIIKRALPIFLVFILLLTLSGPAWAAPAPSGEDYDLEALESGKYDWETDLQLREDYEPNVIIIKFKDPARFSGREKQYQDAVNKVLRTGFEEIGERTYLVEIDELSRDPRAVLNRFKSNRYVEYVEPNYTGTVDLAPTDPLYATRGFIFSRNVNAEAGWDVATSSSVKIGIVDTGYSGSDDLPAASGYSVYNKNTDLTDLNGHGTQVAGVLGAVGCNGTKSAGVVWDANILPVKISESSTVTVANVSQGIRYAADHGARIINLSLSFSSDSTTLRSAVDYAYNKGSLLVAAAGNNGMAKVSYPAAYENVLGVGGTSNGTSKTDMANYGNGLDVLANWTWYTTTARGGVYAAGGTSIASPQVAGLAALAWELAPQLTNAQLMQLIRDNTSRADGVWDSQTGYGTIDMGKTLEAARILGGGAPVVDPEPGSEPEPDVTAPVITLRGGQLVELTEGDTYEEPGYTARDDVDGDLTDLVTVSGSVSTAYAGEYTLTYSVMDQAGNLGKAERQIAVAPAPEPPGDEPTPPAITQIGSNPIILHLEGSPYVEQGAQAFDEIDGDLSAFITTEGDVDTSRPGNYEVTYSVTNSAGLSASVTREVRVLVPQETISRTPYSFSGQGKTGATNSHYAEVEAAGEMELTVSGLNKMTLSVSVIDGSGAEVFSEIFTGNGTRTFQISEGGCQIRTEIVTAKGKSTYKISLLAPEVTTVEFEEEEVPLSGAPASGPLNITVIAGLVLSFGLGTASGFMIKKRSCRDNSQASK